MKASIKQISEITGFSPATISNALNHKKGVNQKTAERIFQVAKEIGYISENKITKIKLVIYKRNGLIIDDSPFFPILLKGVENECRASGYEMVICNVDRNDPDYEEQVKLILNDTSSAILLLGTEMMDEDFPLYMSGNCPMVLLDCWSSNYSVNAVLINNADSAVTAVQYLINKGHREIGYLRGRFRIKAFTSRCAGYSRALSKNNIELNSQYIFTVSTTMDGAYKDMKEYLAKGAKSIRLCALLNKPDRREVEVQIDYLGFDIPDEFVIGYGLDYAQKYRNLPFIGVVEPEAAEDAEEGAEQASGEEKGDNVE